MPDDTLTPDEFREAQRKLGLTDAQLARVLGYADAMSVRRHKVRGTDRSSYRAPSAQAVRLIRAYLEGYRPKDWPT